MSRIWTVARREFRALFDAPTGYILLIAFLGVNNFLFFRQVFLAGVASLRPMLDLLPWILLILVPLATMRALADEVKTGTIEVVLAQPITELELVIGKYLGVLLFLWTALALTLGLPVGLALGAHLPVGVIVAQYVGALLLVAGLAAVGIWTSALSRNQITAAIVGVGVMFVLVLIGLDPLIVGLPPALGALAARLGVLSHFANIGRGVIDLRDAVYFVSLAALFLTLSYAAVLGRRLPRMAPATRRLQAGTAVIAAVVVVVNLLGGYIGGRLDLTPGRAYTLSSATRSLVRNAGDIVTLELFASQELPPEVSLLKRDVDDMLRDLRAASHGNVRVVERDPAKDPQAKDAAQAAGIPPIQFNVIGQSQLQIRQGYMGLAIRYANAQETIPVIQRTDDLEYKIASAIRSMTRTAKPVVGIVMDPAAAAMGQRTFQTIQSELGKAYDVRTVSLEADSEPTRDLQALLLIGSPDSLPDAQAARLRAYLAAGGAALVAAGGMLIDPQQPYFAVPRPVVWNKVLKDYGVTIRPDMVYDLLSNESVALPTQYGRLLTQYPLWVLGAGTGRSVVNEEIASLFLPWTSSVDTAGARAGTITPLFVTSRAGGVSATETMLDPQRHFDTDSLATRLLAVQVNALNPLASHDTAGPRGRLVVVGDAEFASDRQLRAVPENLTFVLNAVDWLAQDEGLIAIRSKDRRPPPLALSEGKRGGVKYANMVGMPLLVGIAGLARLVERRRTMRQTYAPAPGPGAGKGAA
jgi:ABC-type uncharacterized transport system involved in gliding motility auxiliary subunit